MDASVFSRWKFEAALLLVALVWGTNFVVVKAALAVMHPHVFNLIRLLVSALVLGIFHHRRQRQLGQSFFAPLRAHWRALVVLGLIGYGVYQFCFIVGLDHTTTGNAALIMTSVPLWTALMGRFTGHEQLTRRSALGLVGTFLGTLIVVVAGAQAISLGSGTLVGNLIILGAALSWATYTVFNKPVLQQVTPIGLTFLGLLIALPLLAAFAAPYVESLHPEQMTPWIVLALLYSGALSTGLATLMWNVSVKAVGPSHTAVYGNLVPLVAMVTAYLFLGEPITSVQVVGGILIIGGLVVMRSGRGS